MLIASAALFQAYVVFPFYVIEGIERPGLLSKVFFLWVRPLREKGDLDMEKLPGSAPDAKCAGAGDYSVPKFCAEMRQCWGSRLTKGGLYFAIWKMVGPGWLLCNLMMIPDRVVNLVQPLVMWEVDIRARHALRRG